MSNIGMLHWANIDPHSISVIFNCKQEDVEDYMDAHMRAERDAEEHYMRVEKPQVQRDIKLWLEEFPQEWRDAYRTEGLKTEIAATLKNFQEACKWWHQVPDKTFARETIPPQIQELETHLNRLKGKLKVLQGKKEGIQPEQIAHAREHPIGNLVKVVRGMAKCPFHPDNTASMDCRKNFYHCYGCSAQGDVIDLCMKLEGLTFAQAIKRLT